MLLLLDSVELRKIREALEYDRLDEIRNDICKFIEYTQVDENGRHLELGQHHREWLEIIWNGVRDIAEPGKWPPPDVSNFLLFAPRNHGKSTIMDGCIQFLLGKNPRLRIKYVSKNDKLSRNVLGKVAKNIANNKRLHEVFPNLKPDPNGAWSSLAIDVMKVDVDGNADDAALGIKDHNLEAFGVTSPGTGGRADLIIFDDIIGGREAIFEPGRLEKITESFYTDWLSIGGKRHIVVGTPWTSDDILADLSQNSRWKVWRKPAIDEETHEALWPKERPIEWLMEKKSDVGDVAFDLQYLLKGIRPKSEWWSKEIIDGCKDPRTPFGQIPEDFVPEGIVIGFDPAGAMKNTGSYCCIFCLVYDAHRRKLPFKVVRERQQPRVMADALVDMLLEIEGLLTRKLPNGKQEPIRISEVRVENNATQECFVDLIDTICEMRGLNLKIPIKGAFTGSANKWGPESGIVRMAAEFNAKKWIIPFGDKHHYREDGTEWQDPLHECAMCSWIKEMSKYGEAGNTTDMIMGAWLASSAIDANRIGDLPVVSSRRRMSVTNVKW